MKIEVILGGAFVLAIAIMFCLLQRCDKSNSEIAQSREILVIDGCQYITIKNSLTAGSSYSFAITHKGDCSNPIHSK